MIDLRDIKEILAPDANVRAVKEMPADAKPQERAEKYGCAALSNAELLALILRVGQPGMPITDICNELMRACDGRLLVLDRLPRENLRNIPGVGAVRVLQIEALLELAKRYAKEPFAELTKLKTPEDIYKLMRFEIGNLAHEEIWILFLNQSNAVIDKQCITAGSAVASVFDLHKPLKLALLNNARALVMCHNHPSGTLVPSPQDEDITRRMASACKTLDLRLLDHLIITANGFYSFRDNGKLY